MKDFSFIPDRNEMLGEWGVWGFSFKGNKHDIVHHNYKTMSVRPTLTHELAHPHAHAHVH